MSIEHMALVLEAGDLQSQEKALLIALTCSTDPSGRALACDDRLRRMAGMTTAEFHQWRTRLTERHLIATNSSGATYLNLAALRTMGT